MGQSQTEIAARRQSTAAALTLSPGELDTVRARLRASGADANVASAAKSLRVGVDALNDLRRAIATSGATCTVHARAAARLIAAGAATVSARGDIVYLVRQSEVYHRSRSCGSINGAQVQQMPESEAKRKGRRMCIPCKEETLAEEMKPIPTATAIDVDGQRSGKRTKKRAKGTAASKKNANGTSKAVQKRQRAAAEANRRGITVEALQEERRAAAARDRQLSKRAKQLGITVKRLREQDKKRSA